MSNRLPQLVSKPQYHGVVYVAQRFDKFKIGFSRGHADRRSRDAEGELLFVIPAGQQPCVLERIIHRRFDSKRVTDTELWGREWFTLTTDDLNWLRNLAVITESVLALVS